MMNCVILWDNDIGWCEKLQRELAKSEIEVTEPEITSFMDAFEMEREAAFLQKWQKTLLKKEVLAVVVSIAQIMEWIGHLNNKEGVLFETSGECEASFLWWKFLQNLCRITRFPVVVVADRDRTGQELAAFEAGVCDYVEREKEIRICVRRILACKRKQSNNGKLVNSKREKDYLNEKKQSICFGEKEIFLTQKEYRVFSVLWNQKEELVSRREILEMAWGERQPECQRVVDTVVKQLRQKLKETPYSIQTKYRQGYFMHVENGSL